jgi:DNA-binding HxlR family transcriptional regulator
MFSTLGNCAIVSELIGQKWAHHVVVILHHAPRRFNKISQILPQISPTILSGLLKKLMESGILWRDVDLYTLTTFGEEIANHIIVYIKSVEEVSKKMQFGGLQPLVDKIPPNSR